jgi:hypothetical protein
MQKEDGAACEITPRIQDAIESGTSSELEPCSVLRPSAGMETKSFTQAGVTSK